jgi:4-hydroxybenzoate polyprenyltransferase/phosphoserine phosphatase
MLPLCVDLDGTLLRTDSLHEALVSALRRAPWIAFALPFWLLRGRAAFKREVARRAELDPALLPYDPGVLELIRAERGKGRRIVLATAADESIAQAVARHLGLFDEVVASDGTHNLKGAGKASALRERFGERGFDYVGDSRADHAPWSAAAVAYVCGDARTARRLEGQGMRVVAVARTSGLRWPLLRVLRTHQWMKNLLVFVPVVTAHRLQDALAVRSACLAFAAFCLAASGAYVLNDLADLDHDRRHVHKRRRAFAAGELPLWTGVLLAPILLAAAFALSMPLTPAFRLELAVYVGATMAYSLWLKRIVLVDVFTLAALYGVRILAGAAAIPVPVSHWLLVFSLFLFLSLALAKRYAELAALARRDGSDAPGRGYRTADLPLVGLMGVACGQLSVLVFALYITSADVRMLYAHPLVLWLACPVLLYWIARVWLFAYRGELHEDPLVFALRDRVSVGLGLATLAVLVGAT